MSRGIGAAEVAGLPDCLEKIADEDYNRRQEEAKR